MAPTLTLTLTLSLSFPCSLVEGSQWNEGLLVGRPPEEPEHPLTENSLLEVLDGVVMMYNLSVHQQLGKVSHTRVMWFCVSACVCVCPRTHFLQGCLGTAVHVSICHSKTSVSALWA